MQSKTSITDEVLNVQEVSKFEPTVLIDAAVRLGFSTDELRELDRLYGRLETKNAN